MFNLLKEKEYRSLFTPLMFEQLFLMVIQNFNVILFSMYDERIVAATGISNQLLSIGTMFLGIVSLGSSILFLQNADDDRSGYIQDIFQQTLVLNAILSTLLLLVSVFFANPLMRLMQTPADIFSLAVIYLKLASLAFVFDGLTTSISALLRSFSHVKSVMVLSVFQTVMTILANLFVFFVFKDPQQGIVGIALSTLLAKLLATILAFVLLKKHLPHVLDGMVKRKPNWSVAKDILKLGVPSGMENVSYNISQTIFTAIIASLGTAAINAKIYQQTLTDFIFKISVAAGQTGQIKVSQSLRLKDEEATKQFGRKNSTFIFVLSILLGLIVVALQALLIPLLTSDPETSRLLRMLLILDVLYNAFRSVNEVVIAQLNVVGEVKYPVLVGILVTYLFTLPLSYVSAHFLSYGLMAIWIVFILDEGIRAYLFDRRWQQKKML